MNVLIIEDDPNKLSQLVSFLQAELPDARLTERRSYQSGLKEAVHNPPELLVLDMTLPTYDVGGVEKGGRFRFLAGREILSHLQRRKITSKIIVVTQFDVFGEGAALVTLAELRKNLEREFGPQYLGTVYYKPAESSWQADLRKVLARFLGTETAE